MYIVTDRYIAATQPPSFPNQVTTRFPLTGNSIICANNHTVIASGMEVFPEIREMVMVALRSEDRSQMFEKLVMLSRGVKCTFTLVSRITAARMALDQNYASLINGPAEGEETAWEINTYNTRHKITDGVVTEITAKMHFIGGQDVINNAILVLIEDCADVNEEQVVINTICDLQKHEVEYLDFPATETTIERLPGREKHPLVRNSFDWRM
jgi:hypothetical protein